MKNYLIPFICIIAIFTIQGCMNSSKLSGNQKGDKANKMHNENDVSTLYFSYLPMAKKFHAVGSLAPNSAKMTISGEILGDSIVQKDGESISIEFALEQFQSSRKKEAESGEIRASAIFYHGNFINNVYRPAQHEEEANAIVALVESSTESLVLILPYTAGNGIVYGELKISKKEHEVFIK